MRHRSSVAAARCSVGCDWLAVIRINARGCGWMDACVCVYCARACGCPGTRLTERQTLHRKIVDVDITTWRVGRGTWDVVCRTWCVGPGVSDVVRGTWFRGRGACLGCAAKSGGRVPLPRCRVDRAPLAASIPTASPHITASQRTPSQALNPGPFPCPKSMGEGTSGRTLRKVQAQVERLCRLVCVEAVRCSERY